MDFLFIQELRILQPTAEILAFFAVSDRQELFHVKLLCWGLKLERGKLSNAQHLVERRLSAFWRYTGSNQLQFFPEQKQFIINYTRKSSIVFHLLYAPIQIARAKYSRRHTLLTFLPY